MSSTFGGGNAISFGADTVIDGIPAPNGPPLTMGNPAFLTVELPTAVAVTVFGLWTRTMGTSAQIGCFAVENQAGQIFGPFAISDANQLCGFPVTARGQRFTFGVVESSGGNTSEVEIGMFTRRTP